MNASATMSPLENVTFPIYGFCKLFAASSLTAQTTPISNQVSVFDFVETTEVVCSNSFTEEIATTEPKALTHNGAANLVRAMLSEHKIIPDREGITADGSFLFQFLGKSKACVDLYPDGELIVLLKGNDIDEIHELSFNDFQRTVELLKNAGVA